MARLSEREIRERGLDVRAVRVGEQRMRDFHRSEKRKTEHDYGRHRAFLYGDCVYCMEELTYACHRMSDWLFPVTDAEIERLFHR